MRVVDTPCIIVGVVRINTKSVVKPYLLNLEKYF